MRSQRSSRKTSSMLIAFLLTFISLGVLSICYFRAAIETRDFKSGSSSQLAKQFRSFKSEQYHAQKPKKLVLNSTNTSTSSNYCGTLGWFSLQDYEYRKKASMIPLSNVSTIAYSHGPFGGFRNQYMTLTGIMLGMREKNFSQVIAPSIKWKDLFGTNQRLRHDLFFDVVHWNSFYPVLPRFVEYDKNLHPDVNIFGKYETPSLRWNVQNLSEAKQPYAFGDTGLQAQNQYKQYVKRVTEGKQERNSVDLKMMQGAFRPHPSLQRIIDGFIAKHGIEDGYLALHARVEPDMQKHNMCLDLKVKNFTDIITSLERKFAEPPFTTLLILFNRGILESEVNGKDNNVLAKHNLQEINNAVERGLWNGKVKVVEAGVELAKQSGHEVYSKYYSLSGSIIDFFLAVQSSIFIGTEVSSFSVDVEITRFFRGMKNNYHYLPDQIVLTTPDDSRNPPRFKC